MSTLDQAFIRAYQAGRSSAAPQPKQEPVSVEPPVVVAAAVAAPIEKTSQQPRSARKTRSRHFVDGAHGQAAGPHIGATQTIPPETAPFSRTAYEPVYADAALQRERANISGAEGQASSAADDTAPTFRAAFETERFHWPRNVEVLIAATGNEFTQFIAELEERVAAGRQTLVVTGVGRGEGRSTLVLALARLLANRNVRSVVVDVDLRQPHLAELLGIRPELGWDDVYAERLPVTDALIESLADRVTLLPMRSGFSNPRALAGNKTLAGIIDQLKQNYDAVLLDVGPLPDDQDTIDLAAALTGCKLDDALVVRDRRTTSPKDVQAVCRRLAVLGVHHCDIAENFTELQGY